MTKDEAINVLKNAALIGATWIGDEKQFNDLLDAVKMAVEALKQANNSNMSNTSNTLKSLDCVDRQAAIDAIESAKTAQTPDGEIYVAKINAEMNIQILPSVQPVAKDINVSCKDAISRQGAIDHFKSITVATSIGNKYNEGFVDGLNFAVGHLETMPPVHPTYTEAQLQKMQEMHQAEIEKAFELGREDAKPQWIPVAERLPEGGGYYIVTENISEDGDKWVGLRWYSTVHGWEFNPVAWMPFPKPYQEEGEQE